MIPNNGEDELNLHDIARVFFQNMEFDVEEGVTLVGASGKRHQFDMVVKINSNLEIREVVVKIVDWKRAVGVDRLIRFERILTDLNNRKGMLISNSFSDSAISFARRRGLIIYEREHLQIIKE